MVTLLQRRAGVKVSRYIVPANFRDFRVSPSKPCPVCGRPDWCLSDGIEWALCQRVESAERWKDAGWLHRLKKPSSEVRPKPHFNPGKVLDVPEIKPEPLFYPWEMPDAVAIYYYNRPDASPLYRKLRFLDENGKKFTPFQAYDSTTNLWRGGKGCMESVERVLYRGEHLADRQLIFVVEGEKCSDALWAFGLLGVTSDGGYSSWQPDYGAQLAGKDIVIFPDNDDEGRKYAAAIRKSLIGKARSIRTVELPDLNLKGDVADWIEQQINTVGVHA